MNLDNLDHLDYIVVIATSVIIILSYFFNVLSKKTNIPSVILLIAAGMGINYGLDFVGLGDVSENVIEKYPKGNKAPAALLKQGLAFSNIGDTANAKLILQELGRKYPKSNEARVAAEKLKTMK